MNDLRWLNDQMTLRGIPITATKLATLGKMLLASDPATGGLTAILAHPLDVIWIKYHNAPEEAHQAAMSWIYSNIEAMAERATERLYEPTETEKRQTEQDRERAEMANRLRWMIGLATPPKPGKFIFVDAGTP